MPSRRSHTHTGGNEEKSREHDSLPLLRALDIAGGDPLAVILEAENPRDIVQSLSEQDFFWLMKKATGDEVLPLLTLASSEQKQYLLDLEIWDRDRVDRNRSLHWLQLFSEADPEGLAWWIFYEGQQIARFLLQGNLEMIIREPDEELELTDEFFSFDDTLYLRVTDQEHRKTIEGMIEIMYREDDIMARSLLQEIVSVVPSEVEEEQYRLRANRISELGFLPFEEAAAVFSPLEPLSLREDETSSFHPYASGEDDRPAPPVIPLHQMKGTSLLADSLAGIGDPQQFDRIRFEFAGLCNRITAAEGLSRLDFDTLGEKCRKAGGYLNIAVESICGQDPQRARRLMENNPLEHIFRVGFGLALTLNDTVMTWIDESWFRSRGLPASFWGEPAGMILSGLLKRPPRHFTGREDTEYRDFEQVSELEAAAAVFRHLRAMDDLLRKIDETIPHSVELLESETVTAPGIIFTFWARGTLGRKEGALELSIAEAHEFMELLRTGEPGPPFAMPGREERFIRDLTGGVRPPDAARSEDMRHSLSLLWKEFSEEYKWVPASALDRRFARFLLIRKA
ncbi:MAG: hypothetical protein JXO48_10540 [Deltaproteobacteria bacterium]|nr:hypothetical protein [Deltaproteobacteria bacterium]